MIRTPKSLFVSFTFAAFLIGCPEGGQPQEEAAAEEAPAEEPVVAVQKEVVATAPAPAPVEAAPSVTTPVLRQATQAGQPVVLTFESSDPDLELVYDISLKEGTQADLGELAPDGNTVTYTAPESVSEVFEVIISAKDADDGEDVLAAVEIVVPASEDLGVEDDGVINGLVGSVYELPENTSSLPDLSTFALQSSIVMGTIDVPNRSFTSGFPGVEDLYEWFAVRFDGQIQIDEAGTYEFRVGSDDGSILYIDSSEIVNNDGNHSFRIRDGSVALSAGAHDLRLDYYQGPASHIGLQMFWKKPGESEFSIVPSEALTRPAQ